MTSPVDHLYTAVIRSVGSTNEINRAYAEAKELEQLQQINKQQTQ